MALPNARLRGVAVQAQLAPPVSLDPNTQKDLQRAVEDRAVEINYVQRATEGVEFGRRHPNSREQLRVSARPQRLGIEEDFPRADMQFVVKEMDEIVKAALETLRPGILAAITVRVRKQATAPGGDARVYLGERVLQLPKDRTHAFGRPIHMVGVKFMLPPFQLTSEGEGTVPTHDTDGIEVRIESLNEDIADLYIQCEHHFLAAREPSSFESLESLVQDTEKFMDRQVAEFLQIADSDEGS